MNSGGKVEFGLRLVLFDREIEVHTIRHAHSEGHQASQEVRDGAEPALLRLAQQSVVDGRAEGDRGCRGICLLLVGILCDGVGGRRRWDNTSGLLGCAFPENLKRCFTRIERSFVGWSHNVCFG